MGKLIIWLLLLVLVAIVSKHWCCSASNTWTTFNVLRFGARGNGATDSTEAFAATWRAACEWTGPTRIFVPKGRYMVRPLEFEGPCKATHTTLRLDGTLIAPLDYRVLGGADNWLHFRHVNGLDIVGGALDAKGRSLWACKASSKSASCPDGATTLRLTYSSNIKITGLLSLNSQMFHMAVNYCEDVEMRGVRVIASGESPNTDGIHIQHSKNVAIFDSSVKTGDDCVSIGPGTQNLWIERMSCGPGHGISIGSLAKDFEEEGVENVTVTHSSFRATQNGLRIKTWARPSKSFVRGVRFSNITMRNVQNPIIIDQNYCPRDIGCPGQVSGVQISDVLYKGIKGTSTTEVAVTFNCSTSIPCTGITLDDVNLTFKNRDAKSLCSNANGNSLGTILPNSCLS